MKIIFVFIFANILISLSSSEQACSSIPCVLSAATIIEKLNSEVDPCDDFYEYACGSFEQEVHTPDEKSTVNTISIMSDNIYEYLLTVFSDTTKHNEMEPHKVAKDFFNSCMDTSNINSRSREALLNIFRQIGGFPMIDGEEWEEENWDWEKTILKLRKVIAKRDDNILSIEKNINEIEDAKRLSEEDEDFAKLETGIRELIKKFAILMGAIDDEFLDYEIENLVEFEKKFATLDARRRKFNQSLKKSYEKQLRILQNRMNWLHYLSKNSLANPTQNFTDKPKDANKDYFKFLKDTPKRTIANVIGWRIVQRAIPFLGEDVRKILLEYETAVHGKQDNDQRWKFCVSLTTERVAVGVGSLYIDEYFSEEDRKATIKMVDFIQDEYLSTLNSSDWIDNEVKINASKLARKMFKVIGYHEHLRSEDFIKNNFYKNLERWPKENFLELGLALAIFDADREYDRTNQDVKEEWTKYARPATVNAFYSPRDNSIQFPAAILQRPNFDRQRPNVMNFGAIGSIIGHEITHAFDDFALKSKDWSKESRELYDKKVQCVVDHVSSYNVPEIEKYYKLEPGSYKLRGEQTKKEDIADLGGVKLSFNAFQRYRKQYEDQKLIGFEKYSAEKLFFLSFAQFYCTVERPTKAKITAETDEHTLGHYRVLASLSNLKEFADAWECPPNSRMNPSKKCSVW